MDRAAVECNNLQSMDESWCTSSKCLSFCTWVPYLFVLAAAVSAHYLRMHRCVIKWFIFVVVSWDGKIGFEWAWIDNYVDGGSRSELFCKKTKARKTLSLLPGMYKFARIDRSNYQAFFMASLRASSVGPCCAVGAVWVGGRRKKLEGF